MTPEQHLARIRRARNGTRQADEARELWRRRRIRLIREAHAAGLTLREIADAAGYSHETIRTITKEER